MSAPLILYILKAAVRDRLIFALVILLLGASSLSVFLGSAAVVEKTSFVAVYAAVSIRALDVFGLVLFAVFFIRRSFDVRDVEFMLARPIGRISFLLSYAAGFSLLAALISVVSVVFVCALTPQMLSSGHALWFLSLLFENIIMINVALFFSMVLSSAATASFATFGFYVLARMMSQILGIIDAKTHLMHTEILQTVMQTVSMVMPRLDLFTQTSWLVYGPDPEIGWVFITAQGIIYSALILAASCLDLRRRQF